MGDGDHLGARREELGELAQVQIAIIADGNDLDLCALHFGDELPAYNVCVMFQTAD